MFKKKLNISNDTPIDDKEYKKYKRAYKYAMEMVEKECHQAVEAMFHNLNTLQSRSGRIWLPQL